MKSILNKIKSQEKSMVFVSGDLMLDEYLMCTQTISKGENVKILSENKREFFPGGAANVAQNLAALGSSVYLNGVIGSDLEGDCLIESLHQKINPGLVIRTTKRPTTLKTRIINQDDNIVIRRDREDVNLFPFMELEGINNKMSLAVSEANCIVFSDYCKGALNPKWVRMIVNEAQKQQKPIIVDTKYKYPELYSQVSVITPNLMEFGFFLNKTFNNLQSALPYIKPFLERYEIGAMILKGGAEGSVLVGTGQDAPVFCSFQINQTVSSIGAGDSLLAGIAIGISKGLNLKEAFKFGNWVASAVVTKPFTSTITQSTIKTYFSSTQQKN